MEYNVTVQDVPAYPIAAVVGRANSTNISDEIYKNLSVVWDYIRHTGIDHKGQNVVVYLADEDNAQFCAKDGIPIEFGVLVTSDFETSGQVIRSSTPAGQVASVLHIGPYHLLGEAHRAVREYCAENGFAMTGVNWELYGHWTENVDELETEVFYLLRDQEYSDSPT